MTLCRKRIQLLTVYSRLSDERSYRRQMQEKVKQLLGMIRRSAELIRQHERSRPFRDRLIGIGAENITALSEEDLKEPGGKAKNLQTVRKQFNGHKPANRKAGHLGSNLVF